MKQKIPQHWGLAHAFHRILYRPHHHIGECFDNELLCFDGNLELVPTIPFTSGRTAAQSQLTVLLALWYLGMLAANDQGAGR
ncbi:hypothetical protein CBS147332_7527 [Penicillium roqueforti]|nr:hypothetical protein CBS147332_7527 [Penicillium roqueforti]KAI3102906.1 hypothetical protein CBS147331_7554 [Penicillium roqueforti]